MTTAPLYTVMQATSAETVAAVLHHLFPDARTALDATYGSGKFWTAQPPVTVTGLDLNPARARDVCGDFRALPFRDDAFDLVLFDPPHLADAGAGSLMGARFGTYRTNDSLEAAVRAGCREAWRVGRLGAIVKLCDGIHASRRVYMSQWAIGELGEPYDLIRTWRQDKLEDPKWTTKGPQLSARTNDAAWLIYRKDGPVHRRRTDRRGPNLASRWSGTPP